MVNVTIDRKTAINAGRLPSLGGAEEVVWRRRQVSPELLPVAASHPWGTSEEPEASQNKRRQGVLLRGSPPWPPRLCLMSPAFSPLFEFPSGPALGTFMSRCVSTRTSRPFWGFPGGSEGKESTCKVGSIPGSGRFPWRREWQPIPVFLPGESHGQGRLAGSTVHGAAKSRTRLSD